METRLKLMKERRYKEALKNAVAAAKLYPSSHVHLRDIGECEYRMGRLPDAIKHLTRAIELKSDDRWTYNLRYHAYIDSGEYKKALLDCQKCHKLHPASAAAQKDLAMLCSKLSGDKDAKLILANLKETDPVAAARSFIKSSDYRSAIDVLTAALKTPLTPAQKLQMLELRKKCFFKTGDHANLLAELNEIIRMKPASKPYVYLQRANAENALKKYSDSARDLTTVIKMHPTAKQIHLTIDELYYRRAFCYIAMRDYRRAIADYDTLLKIDSTQEEAYKLRGECYTNLGQFQPALDDFAKAIKYDPESSGSSYFARALLHEKMGKKKEAAADRKRAFELGYVPKGDEESHGKW